MLLALACVGWLLFFIHHISHAISVNYIVDRIASETEDVIREIMPWPRAPPDRPSDEYAHSARALRNSGPGRVSGYVRYID